MMQKTEILDFLKQNKQYLAKQFGVKKIALFGSHARNEASEASDIDLMVDLTTTSYDNFCNLKYFLEDCFKKKVDLCDEKSMRLFIKRSIQEDLIYV